MFGVAKLNGLAKTAAAVSRTAKTVSVIGNAQISTALSKFGGASYLSDGTGDGLVINTGGQTDLLFSGDYTYECWIYFSATPSNDKHIMGQAAQYSGSQVMIGMNINKQIFVYVGGAKRFTSSGLASAQWYHVAMSKASGVHRLFIDGVLQANTYTDSAAVTGSTDFHWGREPSASNYAWNGYLDELRISNIARYTATFTPPSAPFTNDANTNALFHFNGTNGSTTFTDDTA